MCIRRGVLPVSAAPRRLWGLLGSSPAAGTVTGATIPPSRRHAVWHVGDDGQCGDGRRSESRWRSQICRTQVPGLGCHGGCEGSPAAPGCWSVPGPLHAPASRCCRGAGGITQRVCTCTGGKLEVKCLKVRSLFSMNLLYLILSTNSNLIASGLKPLQ